MVNFIALSRQIIDVAIIIAASAVVFLVLVVLFRFVAEQIRLARIRHRETDLSFMEIRVPENDASRIEDAEQMFASLAGMDGISTIGDKLFGSDSFVSFEVLAEYESIRFFAICPREISPIVARNINAAYPKAEIFEVKPFTIYSEKGKIDYTRLLLSNKQVHIPIKTFTSLPTDSISSMLENMSNVGEGEAITFQIVIRPISEGWRVSGKRYADSLSNLIASKTTVNDETRFKLNQEMISGINDKISKTGFGVEMKLISRGRDRSRARGNLAAAMSSFSQFSNPGQNSIKATHPWFGIKTEYEHRFPRGSVIMNTAELATLFHFPNEKLKAPNIQWLESSKGATSNLIPSEPGEDFMWLGQAAFRSTKQDVFIKPDDRLRHMYVIGQTGTGKSKLIAGCCLRDIKMGHGTAFIDPHGSDIEWIIDRIPPERMQDVIIIDPSDLARPIGLNMMEFEKPSQKTLIINDMLSIFDKLYDLKLTGGPIFEQYMRNAMMLVMSHPESGNTLLEIPRVLSDSGFRELKLQNCPLPEVVRFWRDEAMKVEGEASLANLVPYITSKLSTFLYNDFIRPIVVQQKSTINFRQAIDQKKIIMIKLSKGLVGDINSNFLGMIIIGKLLMAALSREDIDEKDRHPFYLYIDEFQNFLTDSVYSILSEARKYKLSLTIAHQFISQLVVKQDTKIRDSVFGNIGTRIYMRVGSEDSSILARDLEPDFTAQDLQNQANGWAYTKLLVDGNFPPPFAMHTWFGNSKYDMITDANTPEVTAQIIANSATTYGRSLEELEVEIKQRDAMISALPKPDNPYRNIMPPAAKQQEANSSLLAAFSGGSQQQTSQGQQPPPSKASETLR